MLKYKQEIRRSKFSVLFIFVLLLQFFSATYKLKCDYDVTLNQAARGVKENGYQIKMALDQKDQTAAKQTQN